MFIVRCLIVVIYIDFLKRMGFLFKIPQSMSKSVSSFALLASGIQTFTPQVPILKKNCLSHCAGFYLFEANFIRDLLTPRLRY